MVYPSSPLFVYGTGITVSIFTIINCAYTIWLQALWSIIEPILVYANNGTGDYGDMVPYNLAWVS